MKKVKILSIGIDEFERLFIKPKGKSFPYIYRAAMEVSQDENNKVLYSPKPREWTFQKWFIQIARAVKEEYGILFEIDQNTSWINIDDITKSEILDSI